MATCGTAISRACRPGQHYGYRAHGPYAAAPGATASTPTSCSSTLTPVASPATRAGTTALYGYDIARDDLSFSTLDSAPWMPRSVVVDPSFSLGQ